METMSAQMLYDSIMPVISTHKIRYMFCNIVRCVTLKIRSMINKILFVHVKMTTTSAHNIRGVLIKIRDM